MPVQGLHLIKPTSIVSTGAGNSSSIGTNGGVTFSSCATLSLNGVFSADYDNYMIVCRHVWNTAGSTNLEMRLRTSGTDNSTASSYVRQSLFASSNTISSARNASDFTRVNGSSNAQRDGFVLYVFAPFLSQPTAGRTAAIYGEANAVLWDFAWTHNQSTSYDGFTIYPSTGSITGLLTVYGMRK
jgi:hypothetical protein